ncbi:MAG TPA: type III-A CRISPR-associated protein Cas10/Csm1 [Candidatus Ozemobacteraceae bacterium]|nr:type III-A CRISPR-associated protein Cas10/Csm1 [Candidatus Ozemobacteraceae bacterium]
MDETLLKVALAGFLHDIGKFAQRAAGAAGSDGDLGTGFFPDRNFIDRHSTLYLPSHDGKFTHQHAVFTAAFLDHLQKILPSVFERSDWGEGDAFLSLAAAHHCPTTAGQWAIAMGDRISSGFDRDSFDTYNRCATGEEGFRKTRLMPIFEGLVLSGKKMPTSADEFRCRLPLKKLAPDSAFPAKTKDVVPADNGGAGKEYRELFEQFVFDLDKLEHRSIPHLWLEHFDSLCRLYLAQIPAVTVGNYIPDVSLYDHSRATAALAAAIYGYHRDHGTLTPEAVQNYDTPAILVIQGNFYGIQDFIFSNGGSTNKASGKLIRGRSFYVSLLAETAASLVARELGLTSLSILLNAAGKFTILAPNTDKNRTVLGESEKAINAWLLEQFHGQVGFGICHLTASGKDFLGKGYAAMWARLTAAAEGKKFRRFDLRTTGGVHTAYLEEFTRQGKGLCPFCGKRPARADAAIGIGAEKTPACGPCHDQYLIGENLVKEPRFAVTAAEADLRGDRLKCPIYGRFQLGFDVSGRLGDLARVGHLHHYWDLEIPADGNFAKPITHRFINGHVPRFEEADQHDDRYLCGRGSEEKRLELIDMMKERAVKTFAHIAKGALTPIEGKPGACEGIEAMGVLKADVDNLGLIFGSALPPERMTVSRTATLSRQLDFFFAGYLPWLMRTDTRFQNIYTVFSGGDDLFVIGPWNRIVEFAPTLAHEFRRFVGSNPEVTLSAGISVHKSGDSIRAMAEKAEEGVHASKNAGRDRITLFDRTVTWTGFARLQEIRDHLESWLAKRWLSTGMLYRFTKFSELARQEALLRSGEFPLTAGDLESLSWRAKFKYAVVRNVSKLGTWDEREKAIETVLEAATWLSSFGGDMNIPLWQVLYRHR